MIYALRINQYLKMKTLISPFILLFILTFTACNPDEEVPIDTLPELTTLEAQNITSSTATLGGNIISQGTGEIFDRGVCWSLNTNPTIWDNKQEADGSGLGNYTVEVAGLEPNTTYNVRAYVEGSLDVAYGENISFETGDEVMFTVDIAREILSARVSLAGTVSDNGAIVGIQEKGFVISPSPNPTVNDIQYVAGSGPGNINVSAQNLTHNTVYYARPYAMASFNVYYGEEISFNTAGFFGPAGGYVVYDKGEESEGWRYFEASPEDVPLERWGCDGTSLANTFPGVGMGVDNTNNIVLNCTDTECAARFCFNYSYGGLSDWFLYLRPSE